MPSQHCIARVELHNAAKEVYEDLHEAMKQEGFSALLPVGNKHYRLPTGTYYSDAFIAPEQACTAAAKAAKTIVPKFSIVVTQGPSVFEGLEPA